MSIDQSRLFEAEGQTLARILSFSINLERAGDLLDRNLTGIVNRRLKRGLSFSPEGEADLVWQVDRRHNRWITDPPVSLSALSWRNYVRRRGIEVGDTVRI